MSVGQASAAKSPPLAKASSAPWRAPPNSNIWSTTRWEPLERAYADNEVKIRSLVNDLGAERDAMLSHAERLRSAVVGSHQRLVEDVDGASDQILSRIEDASRRFTALLDERGDVIARDFARRSEELSGWWTSAPATSARA